MSIIGEKIKEIRQKKELSQKMLGEKAGMSQQMIAQYESGKRQPKVETLRRIAAALDVSLLDIADFDQLDEETGLQEITNMMSELSTESLQELNALLKDSIKSDKKTLIEIYNNMTDSARHKLITYAEDLWINPHTHRELKE